MDEVFRRELNLIRKWRAHNRNHRPRAFEDEVYAGCANELEKLIQDSLVLPNEEHWVDRMMNVSKAPQTDEQKRASFKVMLRSFHWMWIRGEYLTRRGDDK
jgi:hypothetical protein